MEGDGSKEYGQTYLSTRGHDVTLLSMYLKNLKEYERLTDKESISEEERLACSCLRLALRLARSQGGRGVALEDLIQEANLGLIEKAVPKFNPGKGQFTTYAGQWILQKAIRAVQTQGRTVRIPAKIIQDWNKIQVLWANSPDLRVDDNATMQALEMTPGRYSRALKYGQSALSLDSSSNSISAWNRPESAGDRILPDIERTPTEDPSPEELSSLKEQMEYLDSLLSRLTPRERAVIEMRWGCNGHNGRKCLRECGDALGGITRERARQIENKAMDKLRKLAGVKDCDEVKLADVKERSNKTKKRGISTPQ